MAAEKEKKEKKDEPTNEFGEWCQMTGWHGILDFYVAKHIFWKICWLIVVAIGCFFAVSQAANMIIDFLSDDEWVTSISYEMPKKGALEMPNITVCVLSSPTLRDPDNEFFSRYILASIQSMDNSSSENSTITEASDLQTALEGTAANSTNMTEVVEESGDVYIVAEMCPSAVLSCGVNKAGGEQKPHDAEHCCAGSRQKKNGESCFSLKSTNMSSGSGDRVYYLLQTTKPVNFELPETGFKITLYLGESDTTDDFSSTFLIQPGTQNVISLISEVYRTKQRQRLISFSKTERLPCVENTFNYTYVTEKSYTKDLCVTDCAIKWQLKYCGCYAADTSVGVMKGSKACSNETDPISGLEMCDLCTWAYTASLKVLYNPEYTDSARESLGSLNVSTTEAFDQAIEDVKCVQQQCPDPCEYGRVETKISSARFVGANAISGMKDYLSFYATRNFTDEDVRQSTMFEMYYEMKQQRVIEKKPRMSLDEFISNLGGCLGVWTGISILSIVQIVFYLVRAIAHRLTVRQAKRKESKLFKPAYPSAATEAKSGLTYHLS